MKDKKSHKIFRIIIQNILLVTNLLFALFYLFALLSTIVPPDKIVFFGFFGVVFPIILFINIIFIILWLFRKKIYWIISLVLILISISHVNRCFTIPFGKGDKKNCKKEIKLLSYNISMLGLAENKGDFFKFIDEVDADIVCFQEFGYWGKDRYNIAENMKKRYKYSHIWYKNQSKSLSWGVATFSKYPVTNKKKIDYESKYNVSIYSDIAINEDTVRVINNHLESNKFSMKDLKQYQDLKNNLTKEEILETSMLLPKKLGIAYKIRALQARTVAAEIKNSPYETVVCGDFNDVPESYAYNKIKGNLTDLRTSTCWGYQYTFRQSGMFVNIDHILLDKRLIPLSMQIPHKIFSDHYPLVGTFGIGH
jgi:endonuclease/exonuclease/phosphatase family metal-dependent hydrolase